MSDMMNRYEQEIQSRWEEYQREKQEKIFPNILILGATGCGKSSLINDVFPVTRGSKAKAAKVSDVYRGTDDFKFYYGRNYGLSINLIDSKGYELSSDGSGSGSNFDSYKNQVSNYIRDSAQDAENKIHLIWYCISVTNYRIQDFDIAMLKELSKISAVAKHIAVVLTKCDKDDVDATTAREFRRILRAEVPFDVRIFETSTYANEALRAELEMDKLMNWSADALGDIDVTGDMKKSFISAQLASLELKKKEALKAVWTAASAAAAIGAVPIPVPDAPLLVGDQVVMCGKIIDIYGLDALAGVTVNLISDVIISNLGKSLVGNLTKLIPGVGSVINASVAGGLTSALGFAISAICYDACEKIAKGESVNFEMLFTFDNITGEMRSTYRSPFKGGQYE